MPLGEAEERNRETSVDLLRGSTVLPRTPVVRRQAEVIHTEFALKSPLAKTELILIKFCCPVRFRRKPMVQSGGNETCPIGGYHHPPGTKWGDELTSPYDSTTLHLRSRDIS